MAVKVKIASDGWKSVDEELDSARLLSESPLVSRLDVAPPLVLVRSQSVEFSANSVRCWHGNGMASVDFLSSDNESVNERVGVNLSPAMALRLSRALERIALDALSGSFERVRDSAAHQGFNSLDLRLSLGGVVVEEDKIGHATAGNFELRPVAKKGGAS
jgi:hypothetical protein